MTHSATPDAHIGSIPSPSDRFWRRWVENPYAFFNIPLAVATAVLLLFPGHSWRERVMGVGVAALTSLWFDRWRRLLRADPRAQAMAHRLWLAFVGVVLTSVLAVIHDAYLVVLLLLIPHFFVALPVAWSLILTVLIAFPTGRIYDTHGEVPDPMHEFVAVLFLRVPIMVMLGFVVRTAAAQNEERRQLLETLAAAERRAGVLEERQRLSREIHDTLAQGFAGILVHLEQADVAVARSVDAIRPHIEFARSVARENLEEARRMMSALRPEVLDQSAGLSAALERVCAEWSTRCGITCTLAVTGSVLPLHPEVEVMLLRATQELLANARKHSEARHVAVTLSYITDVIALDVKDDGIGFRDIAASTVTTDATSGGFGLRALRERAEALGGSVSIESVNGEGATATITVPAFRTETYAVPVEALAAPQPTVRR